MSENIQLAPIEPRDVSHDNIMEVWLFNTCNFRCGYCGLVADGSVLDNSQLDQFRTKEGIDKIIQFFEKNRPGGKNWCIILTGGEPLLMPNFGYFLKRVKALGDSIAIYSNFSVPLTKLIDVSDADAIAYMHASIHPDWTIGGLSEDRFFTNVREVRSLGIPVVVRFVVSPHLLHEMDRLEKRTKEVGVSFFPTTLFDPSYPKSYTDEERLALGSKMVGYSSLLQIEGGVSVRQDQRCKAGGALFATRLHMGGDITPCISTDGPVFGNIFTGEFNPGNAWNNCFKADGLCSCDIHFQQALVEGVDDHANYQEILRGNGQHLLGSYSDWKASNAIFTDDAVPVKQGVLTPAPSDLLRKVRKTRLI